jgi:hypothetical protein
MKGIAHILFILSLIVLVVHGRPAACQESEKSSKEKAKSYFERGVVLFNAGDWEGALENFLVSYEARPHGRLKLNIGVCQYKLGKYAEAGNSLEGFVAEEGASSPRALVEQAQGILSAVKDKVGILLLEANENGAEVKVDGTSFGETPVVSGIHVEPGSHDVLVSAADGRQWSVTVQVEAGESKEVFVTLAAPAALKEQAPGKKTVVKEGAGERAAGSAGKNKAAKSVSVRPDA